MKSFSLGPNRPSREWKEPTIPRRFEDALFSHLVGNVMEIEGYPLILGIHGPAGHGKSFQCRVLLERWNVHLEYTSGSQFESPCAGGPSRLLKDTYRAAHTASREKRRPACILVDDIDAGIGHLGEGVSYTVNRQNVSAALMNLCDVPTLLDGTEVARSAIVVTANALRTLYTPLLRTQRMATFHWETSFDEKLEIVAKLFEGIMPRDQVLELVSEYEREPPSFFSQVRGEYERRLLLQVQGTSRTDRALFLGHLFNDRTHREHLRQQAVRGDSRASQAVISEVARRIGHERQMLVRDNGTVTESRMGAGDVHHERTELPRKERWSPIRRG